MEYLVRTFWVDSLRPTAPKWLASERTYPIAKSTGYSVVFHYWLIAAMWAGVLMLATCAVYAVEKYLLGLKGSPYRMIHNPAEVAMRFFGLSHYAVATYMLLSSKSLRNLRGLLYLTLFVGLSGGLCYLMYLAGGYENKLAVLAVFLMFLVHGLRDETFFYRLRAGKSAISDEEYPHVHKVMVWVQLSGVCLLAGLLYPAYIYLLMNGSGGGDVREFVAAAFPAHWPLAWVLVASSAPFLAGAAFCGWRIRAANTHGLLRFLRSHLPLTMILVITVSLAILSAVVGFWLIQFLILIHFTAWFVFAAAGIAKQPIEKRRAVTWRQPNQWIRSNLVGLWVFHGGLAAIFFAIIAYNHWGMGQAPVMSGGVERANMLSILFGSSSFYYWTILHITLSFMPRPRPKRQ